MSFVSAAPDRLVAAARNLAGIGSSLSASNASAAAPTLAVSAAASDQVSAAVAAFFSGHAQGYQTLSAQAARFHTEFVQALSTGANSYDSTESANASPLRQLLDPTPAAAEPAMIGNAKTANATTEAPAYAAASLRGGRAANPANPRAGTAVVPAGNAASESAGGGSSTEAVSPGGNCGSGGLLLRAGAPSGPGAGCSAGVVRAGASGGLLSRLVDAGGGNERAGVGARNGVWLDGIRGAGLAIGPNGGGAGGNANLVGLWGSETPVVLRGAGAGAGGATSSSTTGISGR